MRTNIFKTPNLALLSLALLMLAILGIKHGTLISKPNKYFLHEDSFQNYIKAAYHVKYDETLNHFEGMNYPYGEHVYHSDFQFLLSNIIKVVSNITGDLSPYVPAIFNISSILAILFCGLMLFLIFRQLELPDWYGMLGAMGVTLLSPQIQSNGLLATFFLLWIIHLMLKFEKKPSIRKSGFIGLIVLFSSFVNAYYFGVLVFLLITYGAFRFLQTRTWHRFRFHILHLIIQIGIPILGMLFFYLSFGHVGDRSTYPLNFLDQRLSWQGLLLPLDLHLGEIIEAKIQVPQLHGEQKAYLGLMAIIGSLLMLITYIWNRFKPNNNQSKTYQQHFLATILPASFILLLCAFGIPFIINGAESLSAYLKPIQQIENLSRYAWVFFYSTNIAVLYWVFQKAAAVKNQIIQGLLMFLVLGVLLFEGFSYSFNRKYDLYEVPAFSSKADANNYWMKVVDVNKYQAILPLPFYHIGADNLFEKTMEQAMIATYQSGLPNIGSTLKRSSISNTFKTMQLAKEPYRIPEILKDLHNDKPLLIWVNKTEKEIAATEYRDILKLATAIYQDGQVELYELPIAAFQRQIDFEKEAIQRSYGLGDLYHIDKVRCTDSLQHFVYQNFDTPSKQINYKGAGGFEIKVTENTILFDGSIPRQVKNKNYQCLVWTYLKKDRYPSMQMVLKEWNAKGELISQKDYVLSDQILTIDGDWALLQLPFTLQTSNSSIQFSVDNTTFKDKKLYFDELLIIPMQTDLYLKQAGQIMKNNRWFETNN